VGGRCVFLGDNRCLIHGDPHYPAVCRGFPWTDAETGGPYRGEPEVCPELVLRPELKAALRPDETEPAGGA
jgi:Fe-S-cluster containining protein